jgi:dTDP-4-dehydrorhamnose reductase
MPRALVLGSTGMLGSAVARELENNGIDFEVASRTQGLRFDATTVDAQELLTQAELSAGDYVINCIGLTKSRIDESSALSRALAVSLNVDFPYKLSVAAERLGLKVIQVATDCVYSGLRGNYSETDAHDPLDVYGKTKSLGEIPSKSVLHLRCSLIGPELGRSSLFFEWVRQQPQGAKISGYTNHYWNGLTSQAFGRIVAGVITSNEFEAGVQHLVPADKLTKDQLVRLELKALGRADVLVESTSAPDSVDRTLTTYNLAKNSALFAAGGYQKVPTIAQMVEEICSDLPN